jgi:hypothetical protein
MRFNATTHWSKNYTARFGNMPTYRAEAIELALYDAMKAPVEEINAAVASLCQSWNQENHPGIRDIAATIHSMRGDNGIQTPNRVVFYPEALRHDTIAAETTMQELKELLKCRPGPVQVWNLICTPLDTAQCRELQRFCDSSNIPYERFVPDTPIEGMSVAGVEIGEMIGAR